MTVTDTGGARRPGLDLRKSLWQRILSRLRSLRSDIGRLFENDQGSDSVAFSISFIALSAKLAKADGQVTRDEVKMFRTIFLIPQHEERNAGRVYDLCRTDVSGFEVYARKMSAALGSGEAADARRLDVLDGLFHIAMADGEYHPAEDAFLREVAEIFDIPDTTFQALLARHVPGETDPFQVLGVPHDVDADTARTTWRKLVKDNHPDRLIARGLPEEMIALATSRLAAINQAYEEISAQLDARPSSFPDI